VVLLSAPPSKGRSLDGIVIRLNIYARDLLLMALHPGIYVSHPVLEGKPNANHVCARISYSRTQQLHNMDIITQCSK
jgi:hypothetical protein